MKHKISQLKALKPENIQPLFEVGNALWVFQKPILQLVIDTKYSLSLWRRMPEQKNVQKI